MFSVRLNLAMPLFMFVALPIHFTSVSRSNSG